MHAIVAGVDRSPEGARAARIAARIAEVSGTPCHLVHAVGDPWLGPVLAQIPFDVGKLNQMVVDSARTYFDRALRDAVPGSVLANLDIRLGHAAITLQRAAREYGAGLLVLGGKAPGIGRWLAGSTVHQLVRTVDVPLLVTGPSDHPIRRVLVAVDLSAAVRPTLDAAQRLARMLGAEVRVVHAVEPLPALASSPLGIDQGELVRRTRDALARQIPPTIGTLVHQGPAADVISEMAAAWPADVVVVGSHGKGWAQRVIIGSTTERLLNRLPAAVLVVPIPRPAAEGKPPRSKRATQPA